MLTFHSFRALGSTYSRLHHLLPNSFNAYAISSLHFFKSIREGNLYFGTRQAWLSLHWSQTPKISFLVASYLSLLSCYGQFYLGPTIMIPVSRQLLTLTRCIQTLPCYLKKKKKKKKQQKTFNFTLDLRARLGTRKTGLNPQYFNSDRSNAVFLLWFLTVTCSCFSYLYFGSPIMWVAYLGSWMNTFLGKSCSFGLPRMPFVNCCQFMYLVVSLLVLRAGYGIWLY